MYREIRDPGYPRQIRVKVQGQAQMTSELLTCPSCGQRHRIPPNPPPNARWKCGKCGKLMQRPQDPPAEAASVSPPPSAQHVASEKQTQGTAQAPPTSPETRLQFAWPVALKSLAIGGGIVAAGVAIIAFGDSTGATIGGGILALIGLGALGVMLLDGLGGTGSCPICAAEIVATSNTVPNKFCPSCHQYLSIRKGMVRPLEAAALTDKPTFAAPTPWTDLKAVTYRPEVTLPVGSEERVLPASWPDGCCVCGEPATRLEDRTYIVYKWKGELVRINQTQVTLRIEGVPYCGTHADGLSIDQVNFQDKGDDEVKQDLALVFRSYAYRNRFIELNPWPWR
jgi:hypothetical protein